MREFEEEVEKTALCKSAQRIFHEQPNNNQREKSGDKRSQRQRGVFDSFDCTVDEGMEHRDLFQYVTNGEIEYPPCRVKYTTHLFGYLLYR